MTQPMEVKVLAPTSAELMGPAEAAYKDAIEVVIDSDMMRDIAVEERTALRSKWTQLEAKRKEITGPLLKAKEAVDALFKPALDRLEAARGVLDKAILGYNAEQARKAREEQARLEAAAKAERERAEREAAEAARKAAELAQQAAQAATAEEAEKLAKQAEEAEQEAAAAAVVAETVVAPVAVTVPKMTGASTRATVDFEEVDRAAFVKWIAKQLDSAPHLANLLIIDSVKMRAFVKTYGPDGDHQQVPGIKIFEKQSLSSRKAA